MNEKEILSDIQVEKMMSIFEFVCPSLDDYMKPHFILRDIQECPDPSKTMGDKGDCQICDYLLATKPDDDRTYFAHGVYKLACMYNTYDIINKKERLVNCKKCGQKNVDYSTHYCVKEIEGGKNN